MGNLFQKLSKSPGVGGWRSEDRKFHGSVQSRVTIFMSAGLSLEDTGAKTTAGVSGGW
jgi:hypothetical protein